MSFHIASLDGNTFADIEEQLGNMGLCGFILGL